MVDMSSRSSVDLAVETVQRMLPATISRDVIAAVVRRLRNDGAEQTKRTVALDDNFQREMQAALGGATQCVSCVDPIVNGEPADVMLGAHHLVVTRHPSVRLIVAGEERPAGAGTVERFIVATHLDTVWRTSPLTEAERNTLVARSSVLIALSPAPSVWLATRVAMALGTPVITRDVGALALLVGDAGVVLPKDSGARHFAVAIERILTDEFLRRTLERRASSRSSETAGLDAVPTILRALHEAYR
jgi:hypothetical protein